MRGDDAYALNKKYTDSIVTGDVSVTKNADGSITFSANGGQSSVTLSADEVRGRGIKSAIVNDEGHLIITYSDNTVEDLGLIKGKNANVSVKDNTDTKLTLELTNYDSDGNPVTEITPNLKAEKIEVIENSNNADMNYKVDFITYDEEGNHKKIITSPKMKPTEYTIQPNTGNNAYSYKTDTTKKDENGTVTTTSPNLKGNIFWEGTDLVGDSIVFEVKAEDGINYSRINDLYLNTNTSNIYKRTDKNNVNNTWELIGCIKGIQGDSAYDVAVEQGYTGTKSEWLLSLVGQSNLTEKRWTKPLISEDTTDLQVWYYYQTGDNAWKYILTPPDDTYPAGKYAFNLNTKYYTFTSTQELVVGNDGTYDIKYIADERNSKITAYLTNKETSEKTEYTLDITITNEVPEGYNEVIVETEPLGKWVQTMYLGQSKNNCEEITITTGMSLEGIITADVFYNVIGEGKLKTLSETVKGAINEMFDLLKANKDTVLNTTNKTVFEAINELYSKHYMDCYELIDSDLLTHCLNAEYNPLSVNFIYCENCTSAPESSGGYGYAMLVVSQDTHYRQVIFYNPADSKIYINNIGANEANDGFGEWSGWNYELTSNDMTQTVNSNSTHKQIPSAKAVFDSIPIGTVQAYYGRAYDLAIPDGWMLCDGSIVNDVDSPLNGKALPDMRNRVLAMANSVNSIGTTAGSNTVKLNRNQLPNVSMETTGTLSYTPKGTITIGSNGSHSHSITVPDNTTGNPDGATDTSSSSETKRRYWRYPSSGYTGSVGSHNHSATFTGASQTLAITTSGSLNGGVTQQSINNMQSTIYIDYIMKIK